MASSAVFGKGTLLRVDLGSGYVTIPECRNIAPPGVTRDEIEVTNHDSVGAFKEFIGGNVDGGEVTADCNYIPTDSVHRQLIEDAANTTSVPRSYRVLLPGGGQSVDFTGYMNRFDRAMPHDAQLTGNLSIRVTGQPVENYSP